MNKALFWKLVTGALTIFGCFLIPVYWGCYGIENFLWLSDVGLFLTIIGLWAHSRLLISMAAVGVLALELVWNVDFFAQLIFNVQLIHLADYMFDGTYSLTLRGLSLFHVFMPLVWIAYLKQYGYDKRALYYFTILYWLILSVTYFFTSHQENINWVFLPQAYALTWISPLAWCALLFISFPLLVFLPSHYVYKKIFS